MRVKICAQIEFRTREVGNQLARKISNEARKDDDAKTDTHVTGSTSNDTEVLTYDQKRGELVKQDGLELDRFDAMTKEMNLAKNTRT